MYESMKNTVKALNTTASEAETLNESGVISNAHRIDKELRKLGLTNGTSLGHHSGFADEVADCIESLLDLIEDLESCSMSPSKSPDITKTPTIKLPNGDQIGTTVAVKEKPKTRVFRYSLKRGDSEIVREVTVPYDANEERIHLAVFDDINAITFGDEPWQSNVKNLDEQRTSEPYHTANSSEESSHPMGIIRRVDDLGRIAIPKEIRKYVGIHEGDEMNITFMGRTLILTPIADTPLDAVETAISRLDACGMLKQELQNVIANYKRKAAKGGD